MSLPSHTIQITAMIILTDFPGELLLKIIRHISPLYLDHFLLSCKQMYALRVDTVNEHQIIRSNLARMSSCDLLKLALSDADTALYPTFIELESVDGPRLSDHVMMVNNAQALTEIFTRSCYSGNPRPDLAVPVLLTQLLNLRRLDITVGVSPYLIAIVTRIVSAIHRPSVVSQEPTALGRLTQVTIRAGLSYGRYTYQGALHVTQLASLMAMIPTVRKLKVFAAGHCQYTSPSPGYLSGVTELYLSGPIDSVFLEDLIGRTVSLKVFTCYYETSGLMGCQTNFAPRRVVQDLAASASHSLVHLSLIVRPLSFIPGDYDERRYRRGLLLGDLGMFGLLTTLRTSIDMLTMTPRTGGDHATRYPRTRKIQNVMKVLPPSLETLVLDEGQKAWHEDDIDWLLEDLTEWKEWEDGNLKLVNFANCADFEEYLSDETKDACHSAGVKLGYSMYCGEGEGCDQMFERHGNWEERPWIKALERCCEDQNLMVALAGPMNPNESE